MICAETKCADGITRGKIRDKGETRRREKCSKAKLLWLYIDEVTAEHSVLAERGDSIWIFRSFLLPFRERRKSNVGGRTERLKGGVNGSISAVAGGKTRNGTRAEKLAAARNSRARNAKENRIGFSETQSLSLTGKRILTVTRYFRFYACII